jgi:hypothetical protein
MALVSLNALRRFLRGQGCLEVRELRDAKSGTRYLEIECQTKRGARCRARLAVDVDDHNVAPGAFTVLGPALAACLGADWVNRIPPEDPFG